MPSAFCADMSLEEPRVCCSQCLLLSDPTPVKKKPAAKSIKKQLAPVKKKPAAKPIKKQLAETRPAKKPASKGQAKKPAARAPGRKSGNHQQQPQAVLAGWAHVLQ